MCSARVCALGTLSIVSMFLMVFAIVRFFDSMNPATGAVMVGAWLSTIGLCYLTDRAGKQARSDDSR